MNVRWRLGILLLQIAALTYATYWITGRPYAAETWYAAGMLALVINPQILEPYYPRPGDVVANGLICLLLFLTANRTAAPLAWTAFLVVDLFAVTLGMIALAFGAGRKAGRMVGIARAATVLTRVATSRSVYSIIFWLGLLSYRSTGDRDFWVLGLTWAGVTVIGVVNWQAVWGNLGGGPIPCVGEGMIGPSLLVVSAPDLPSPGTPVQLSASSCTAHGVVLSRIHRDTGYWGQIHIDDLAACEQLARASVIGVAIRGEARNTIGAVLAPSSDTQLQFVSTRELETGDVVAVRRNASDVLYQIRWAVIEEARVKGGAQHVVRAFASQLGVFTPESHRLVRHRWVPALGGAVYLPTELVLGHAEPPSGWLRLGRVGDTDIPLYLDCDSACDGHIAILGMTRMGKTTLALRLASHLAKTRRVTVLDQTGEWVSRKGLPAYASGDDEKIGLSVREPRPNEVYADWALTYLKEVANTGWKEYKEGKPLSRVLIIDEAHQFVPEPAMLSFGQPGRDAASNFGLLMMQVRKYGITIVLVSQRTAVVAKSALSQCENLIAFKSVDHTGLEYLEAILGSDARKALPSLRHHEALAFGPSVSSELAVGVTLEGA